MSAITRGLAHGTKPCPWLLRPRNVIYEMPAIKNFAPSAPCSPLAISLPNNVVAQFEDTAVLVLAVISATDTDATE